MKTCSGEGGCERLVPRINRKGLCPACVESMAEVQADEEADLLKARRILARRAATQ